MKLTKYELRFNEDLLPQLVKEPGLAYNLDRRSCYPNAELLDEAFVAADANQYVEEHVLILALNSRLRPIAMFEISSGGFTSSVVDVKSVFTRLMLAGASNFAMFHNHPSGDWTPSTDDLDITRRLVEGGKILDIRMIDHIIGTPNGEYCSLYSLHNELF